MEYNWNREGSTDATDSSAFTPECLMTERYPDRDVPRELEMLDDELNRIKAHLSDLEDRLNPVLSPRKDDGYKEAEAPEHISPLAESIRDSRFFVQGCRNDIVEMLERLQI